MKLPNRSQHKNLNPDTLGAEREVGSANGSTWNRCSAG